MIATTNNYKAADAAGAKAPVVAVRIAGYGRVLSTRAVNGWAPWISGLGSLSQSVDELNGSSSLNNLDVTAIDYRGGLTADFPAFLFEGREATVLVGYDGLAEADFMTLMAGYIETVVSGDDNTSYTFSIKDKSRLAQQVIYLAGDDGFPTSNDHPRTVRGNPLDILINVLQTQVGYADHEVDLAKIQAYRDTLFAGLIFEFSITSPPEAKNFIEQELLKPLGGFGYTNNLGQYSLDFLQPIPDRIAPVFEFTPANLVELPAWAQADLVNAISFRFDYDGSKFMAEAVELYQASVDRFGQQGQQVVESAGARSGYQGFSMFSGIARAIFARYGWRNPQLQAKANWKAAAVAVGDYVCVTHPLIPNRDTGAYGVVQKLFQVLGRDVDLNDYTVALVLKDASRIQAIGTARIRAASPQFYTQAPPAEQARYLWVTDVNGKQSNGDQGKTFA